MNWREYLIEVIGDSWDGINDVVGENNNNTHMKLLNNKTNQ